MTRMQRDPRDVDEWLEKLAWLMDRSIKVGPWSIGLDGIIGLIPGFGDATGGLLSSMIVLGAIQAGIPRAAIARMMANVAIDSVVGMVPFVGDLFDFAFKANTKNVTILREALRGERRRSKDWGFLFVILIVLLILIALPLIAAGYLMAQLF